jgi:PIN domain nuclease of toxin-antitoxin system
VAENHCLLMSCKENEQHKLHLGGSRMNRLCILLTVMVVMVGAFFAAHEAVAKVLTGISGEDTLVGTARDNRLTGRGGDLASLGLSVVSFGEHEAAVAAVMWDETRRLGLGLADRACMATAVGFGLPALTADRQWLEVEWEGLLVELIR